MYGSATTVGQAGPACAGSEVEGSLLEPLVGRHSSEASPGSALGSSGALGCPVARVYSARSRLRRVVLVERRRD